MKIDKDEMKFELETLKSEPLDKIVTQISNKVSGLNNISDIAKRLRQHIQQKGFGEIALEDKEVIFSCLLSVILADIGRQQSPYVKENNLNKIRVICERKEISIDFISNISTFYDEHLDIIFQVGNSV